MTSISKSITKRTSLVVLALVMAVLSLVAAACASTSANNDKLGSALPNGTTNTGSEQFALASNDFGTYATFAAASGSQQAGIWVSGIGTVSLEPDIAYLYLGIEAQATTVTEARDQAARDMEAVFAALRARGVADKDIRTTYFSIQPRYEYPREGSPILVGYTVTNQVSVTVRDLDTVGPVIDDVANAGGDNTRINGISFGINDDSAARVQARELAVKDAMAKAKQFAELTGVTLGKLMFISESGGSVVYPERYAKDLAYAEGAAVPTPISAGEMDVVITVQAVFGIE